LSNRGELYRRTNVVGLELQLRVGLFIIYYINRTSGTQTITYNKCTQSDISAQTAYNVRHIK